MNGAYEVGAVALRAQQRGALRTVLDLRFEQSAGLQQRRARVGRGVVRAHEGEVALVPAPRLLPRGLALVGRLCDPLP